MHRFAARRRNIMKINCAIVEAFEPRRLLCVDHAGGENWTEDLDAAVRRGGADHTLDWYTPVGETSFSETAPSFPVNAAGLPLLSSRADGQGLKVFLDFDGHGTNSPFDLDGNSATFNAAEQEAIYLTWRDQISYFSALNVNITTIQPPTGAGNPLFAWHLTSNSISGGYAFVGSLSNTEPRGFNQGSNAVSRRSGIAHEIGHLLNLQHQSEYSNLGVLTSEYSDGWDSRHRTVIGIDYNTNIRQWFYGRRTSTATLLQDDLQTMANKVATQTGGDGFRPDDFGNTLATAFAIPAGTQRIEAFLERFSDADVFSFTSSGQRWMIDATPTFESAVEPKIELLDSSGNLIAARDDADQRANINNNDVEFTIDLAPGQYFVRITSSGDISELGEYLLTASPIMSGWRSADVGANFRAGTSSFDEATGAITQLGGGSDIAGTADQFRFTYNVLDGDGSITARVDSLDLTDAAAKTGVMIRQSLATNSAFAMMLQRPDGRVERLIRTSAGGTAASGGTVLETLGQTYLRVARSGNSFTMSYSADGVSFTVFSGPVTIDMSGPVLIGLATTSRNLRYAAFSTFSELTHSGNIGQAPPVFNALPAPTSLTAAPAAGASTAIVLNWGDVAGESGYAIERSVDGVNFTPAGSVGADVTTFSDTGAFGSMRWWYRVSATGGGTSPPSNLASTMNKPSAPANPPASYARSFISASASQILLNWTDVQGDEGYRIERSIDGVNFAQIATTARNYNAYNDIGLSAGQIYIYRITPLTSIGDGQTASLLITAQTRLSAITGLAFTARQPTSMSITWNDAPNETGYRIERSLDGSNWLIAANLVANATTWTDPGVTPLNEYYYRVIAITSLTASLLPAHIFSASPNSAPPPAPWTNQDVGVVAGAGAASGNASGADWTMLANGTDINGFADSMHFIWRTLEGNGEIIARVASIEATATNTKAGLMMRQSLDLNSAYVGIFATSGNGVGQQYRINTGNSTAQNSYQQVAFAPVWLRIRRINNVITTQRSADGVNWTNVGATPPVTLNGTLVVGLAGSSAFATQLARSTFTNVALNAAAATTINITPASPSVAPNSQQQFAASVFDQFGTLMNPQPVVSWGASRGSIDTGGLFTAPLESGPLTITANSGGAGGQATATVRLVNIERGFAVHTPQQQIDFLFNGIVSASLSADDVQLTNLTTGQVIASGVMSVTHVPAGAAVRENIRFPGLPNGALPDGNYRAAIAAGSISDEFGTPLFSDVLLDFFALAGDANRDRAVNIDDFGILAGRFNAGGNFTQGDFNYSGTVEIGDFAILASSFNKTLPTAADPPRPTAAAQPAQDWRHVPRLSEDLFGIA